MFQIKERLKKRGKTQAWLILEVRKRGVAVQPPEMSQILNGVSTYPKSLRVLKVCDEILSELEKSED